MLQWIKIVLDILFALGFLSCAVSDWQRRIIPGKLVAFLTILGLVQLGLMLGMGVSIWPNMIALLVTTSLYFFWTMNWICGGDVLLLFKLCWLSRKCGRNPRQKIALGPPLALGCAGCMAAQYIATAIH